MWNYKWTLKFRAKIRSNSSPMISLEEHGNVCVITSWVPDVYLSTYFLREVSSPLFTSIVAVWNSLNLKEIFLAFRRNFLGSVYLLAVGFTRHKPHNNLSFHLYFPCKCLTDNTLKRRRKPEKSEKIWFAE